MLTLLHSVYFSLFFFKNHSCCFWNSYSTLIGKSLQWKYKKVELVFEYHNAWFIIFSHSSDVQIVMIIIMPYIYPPDPYTNKAVDIHWMLCKSFAGKKRVLFMVPRVLSSTLHFAMSIHLLFCFPCCNLRPFSELTE